MKLLVLIPHGNISAELQNILEKNREDFFPFNSFFMPVTELPESAGDTKEAKKLLSFIKKNVADRKEKTVCTITDLFMENKILYCRADFTHADFIKECTESFYKDKKTKDIPSADNAADSPATQAAAETENSAFMNGAFLLGFEKNAGKLPAAENLPLSFSALKLAVIDISENGLSFSWKITASAWMPKA